MLTMAKIKKWATDTLTQDTTFQAECTSVLGQPLNIYRSSPVNYTAEILPFLTAFSDESNQDFLSSSDFSKTWSIPFALAIQGNDDSFEDAGMTVWDSSDKVEQLATAMSTCLRDKARHCGIYGEDAIILSIRIVVTELGEADDVQANIFLTFGIQNHI